MADDYGYTGRFVEIAWICLACWSFAGLASFCGLVAWRMHRRTRWARQAAAGALDQPKEKQRPTRESEEVPLQVLGAPRAELKMRQFGRYRFEYRDL